MSKYDLLKLPKRLVIVESPAKCKKIEQYLGSGYTCIASYGHLRTLSSLKDVDIENNFDATYSTYDDPQKTNQIKKIREEISKVDEVILASDDDREGEAIAWHICMLFNLPLETTKRIIFHEITEEALLKAISAPTKINMNIVYSQQARQILDVLVGFTISPLLWKLIQTNKSNALSAGRCQTPALRLIYDNYKDIRECKGRKVYTTTGYFTKLVLPFVLNKEYETDEDMEYFLENTVNHTHIITRSEPKQTTKKAPEPFTTSKIQQAISNEFHYSPKETMRICQTLYEHGLITYMRTDSKKYCTSFVESCKTYIKQTYNSDQYISSSTDKWTISDTSHPLPQTVIEPTKNVKTSKSKKPDAAKTETNTLAQEAHEAIRPTNILITPNHAEWPSHINANTLEPKELKIYDFIWRNSLESLMADATFSSFTTSITAFENNIFKYTSEQVGFPGWLIVANKYEKISKDHAYLLALKQNVETEYKKITATQTIKNLKSHYSEAHLVSLLEENGVGRPSTYASLVDKIQERNYVRKEDVPGVAVACKDFILEEDTLTETSCNKVIGNEKNKLVIQQLGIIVVEFLEKHFEPLFNYNYTKTMEDILDKIASGQHDWRELCKTCNEQLTILMDPLKNERKLEIKLDEMHSYIISKNGPVIKRTDSISKAVSFIPVKQDIDMQKLENGEYKLEDVIAPSFAATTRKLGTYKNEDLILKKGKYGLYVTYGENKTSMACLGNRPIDNITYGEVFLILEQDGILKPSYYKDQKKQKIVREVNASISIRKSDKGNGNYIFYKTTQMTKPTFFDMKTFEKDTKLNPATCDMPALRQWIANKHNI
jgi:DNA topoisomerase-1